MSVDVLIVEDNAEQRGLLEKVIRSMGWRPHSTGSAREAIAKAAELRPGLVITDIQLTDGDGFELCRCINEDPALQGTPVIMLTGTYLKDETRLRAECLGAAAYFRKPVRLTELMATALKLLGGAAER